MAEHIRIYGAYLWELCTAPILPFEFVSVADQFKARIGELAAAGKSVGVDSLGDACRGPRDRRAAAGRESKILELDSIVRTRQKTPLGRTTEHLHQDVSAASSCRSSAPRRAPTATTLSRTRRSRRSCPASMTSPSWRRSLERAGALAARDAAGARPQPRQRRPRRCAHINRRHHGATTVSAHTDAALIRCCRRCCRSEVAHGPYAVSNCMR